MKSYPRVRPNCSFIRLSKKRHDFHYFFLLSFFFFLHTLSTEFRASPSSKKRTFSRVEADRDSYLARDKRCRSHVCDFRALLDPGRIFTNTRNGTRFRIHFVWMVILLFRSFILDMDYDCL